MKIFTAMTEKHSGQEKTSTDRLRILITGSTGGIGSAIKERLEGEHEVIPLGHQDVMASDTFGTVDWLICAHGVLDEEDIMTTMVSNVVWNISLARRCKGAKIIFISSTAGIKGNDKYPVYAASKAALNTYGKSISKHRECYLVCPGPTDTKMWRNLNLDGYAQYPSTVAGAVEDVISGQYKSGSIITVRNGLITCEQ